MADVYVWSGSGSTPRDGSDWDHAYLSFADADSNVNSGDVVYVASDHSKDYAALTTITFPSSVLILSVDRTSGARTPGGSEINSTPNGITINFGDSAYVYGMTLGVTNANGLTVSYSSAAKIVFDKCTFHRGGTTATALKFGNNVAYYSDLSFIDCTFVSTYTSQSDFFDFGVVRTVYVKIVNPTFTISDTDNDWKLCASSAYGMGASIEIVNADLSKFQYLTSDDTINAVLRKCKIHSSLTISSATASRMASVSCYDCGTGEVTKTLSQLTKSISYYGTCEHDETNYRSASDGESTYAIKMSPDSTNATIYTPLELPTRLAVWHDASGSKTLTIYLSSSDSGLLDNEIFAYVTSVDSDATSSPVGEFVSTRGNGAAADTSTYLKSGTGTDWTNGGGSEYKIVVTEINPAEPGYVYVQLFAAYTGVASHWVDPAITLT